MSGASDKARLKRRLYARSRRCCFCKRERCIEHLTFEHVLPKSAGGKFNFENLALSCHTCNQERGITEFEVFKRKKKLERERARDI